MGMETILFYVLAGIVLHSAILVVTLQNLVRSVFVFFVTLFALAGVYLFALADFIAVTQVVVYVGGVLVLMLFALMLSNRERLNELKAGLQRSWVRNISGGFIALTFFAVFAFFITQKMPVLAWMKEPVSPLDNTVKQIGVQLMSRYLLPFEVISVFLLMALIGAAHIARKERSV